MRRCAEPAGGERGLGDALPRNDQGFSGGLAEGHTVQVGYPGPQRQACAPLDPTSQHYVARFYTGGGWAKTANYKTWATDLWITNDQEGYDAARAAVAEGGAEALRAYVSALPDIARVLRGQGDVPTSGLAADLYEDEQRNARETRGRAEVMRDALARIDWPEIVEALREE